MEATQRRVRAGLLTLRSEAAVASGSIVDDIRRYRRPPWASCPEVVEPPIWHPLPDDDPDQVIAHVSFRATRGDLTGRILPLFVTRLSLSVARIVNNSDTLHEY